MDVHYNTLKFNIDWIFIIFPDEYYVYIRKMYSRGDVIRRDIFNSPGERFIIRVLVLLKTQDLVTYGYDMMVPVP